MAQLSHVDDQGRVRMVDTGNKEATQRRAVASARVLMTEETVAALREHRTPKGDPLKRRDWQVLWRPNERRT
jgi:cyclic pyranopterin phosphate synthase